ncbi:MAG: FAD-dependent oxidoreductase [Eubacteriales bacterium]|jgi:thioredoxin reductase (NADPH)
MGENENTKAAESFDLIIIGGGTAGLTAALYAARAGVSVLVLESGSIGGQIAVSPEVENYPGIPKISGAELGMILKKQAESFGAIVRLESVKYVENVPEVEGDEACGRMLKRVATRRHLYTSKALILATGAANRRLGVAREQELTGSGVSYCAVCDGAFFRGKDVAVVGGGNTALDDASYLADICSKVYLIHRRDEFRGNPETAEKLSAKPQVVMVMSSQVTELLGSPVLTGISVENRVTGEVRQIPVSALFVAVGQQPQNEMFRSLVDLTPGGYIAAGEDCMTRTPGVFAAGDCRDKKVRQLTTAASDGAVAALAAADYIRSF